MDKVEVKPSRKRKNPPVWLFIVIGLVVLVIGLGVMVWLGKTPFYSRETGAQPPRVIPPSNQTIQKADDIFGPEEVNGEEQVSQPVPGNE